MAGISFIFKEEMSMSKISYLCKGERECSTNPHCFKNGGECRYSDRVQDAVNFVEFPYPGSDFFVEQSEFICPESVLPDDR